jgi:hypothetical protein
VPPWLLQSKLLLKLGEVKLNCMVSTLCFGSVLGLKETYIVPDTHSSFEGLNITAAVRNYFAAIFAIANWPFRKRRSIECVHPIAEKAGSR